MILINETAHLLREREQLMISFGGKMGGGEGGGGGGGPRFKSPSLPLVKNIYIKL